MDTSTSVTEEEISEILSNSKFKAFHRIFGKQCVVVVQLPNGFTLVGESACVDPSNYNGDMGFNLAIKDIEDQLCMLEGYLLQDRG